MSIQINSAKCIGCGRCTEACPGNLLFLQDGKAQMREVRDCWGCTACMKECPVAAISYFLGADIGGTGAQMTIQKEKNLYHWTISKGDEATTITIDKNNANQY